jgi:hypothetical protein
VSRFNLRVGLALGLISVESQRSEIFSLPCPTGLALRREQGEEHSNRVPARTQSSYERMNHLQVVQAFVRTRHRSGFNATQRTNIRQRFEYSRRAFQASDGSRAFEGGYQCGCDRGRARGSETASPEMLRNNLGRLNKSACYPLGQLSIERGQLIRQILHEASILEISVDHFGCEGAEKLMHKIQRIARRIRRDSPQYIDSARNVLIDGFFCELCLAAWKVKVERSFRRAAFFKDLDQAGRGVALDAEQSLGRGNCASTGVSFTWHALNLTRFA